MLKITAETLEGSWTKTIKAITEKGNLIKEDIPFVEVQDLFILYNNAFEVTYSNYVSVFGDTYLDYMSRVYSPDGDKVTGRNYFDLIYNHSGVNQVKNIVRLLEKEPLSRSAIITLANPIAEKKPCVISISFSIRNGFLSMSVFFKSSDIAKKLIPDMIEISKIHKVISQKLHIPRGHVSLHILCAQLYTSDITLLKQKLEKLKESEYFKTENIVENWDKEADRWDEYLKDPQHYVNFENGYSRYIDFMNKYINHTKNKAIALDSGSGTGVISEILNKKGYNTIGIDISPKMLSNAHRKNNVREYTLANSLDIPYEDAFFDIICSRGVLISHVGKKYTDLFLKEHSRVLKKGGYLMIDFITHFNRNELKKKKKKMFMSFNDMVRKVEEFGFEVIARSGDDTNRVNAILCKKV